MAYKIQRHPAISTSPVNAQDVGFVGELIVEFTFVRVVHGIADRACRFHGGRGDQNTVVLLLQRHEPPQRVLRLLTRFNVMREMENLVAVVLRERTAQFEIATGILIVNPTAGGAEDFACTAGRRDWIRWITRCYVDSAATSK